MAQKSNIKIGFVPWTKTSTNKPDGSFINKIINQADNFIEINNCYLNIVDQENLTVNVPKSKFRTVNFDWYNWIMIDDNNSPFIDKRYYFINSYDYASENIVFHCELDIWSTYYVFLFSNLKENIKLKRGHINSLKRESNKLFISNYKLYLSQDDIPNINNYYGEITPYYMMCTRKVPVPKTDKYFSINFKNQKYYIYAIIGITYNEALKLIPNLPDWNVSKSNYQPPFLFISALPSLTKYTDYWSYLVSPNLISLFASPVPIYEEDLKLFNIKIDINVETFKNTWDCTYYGNIIGNDFDTPTTNLLYKYDVLFFDGDGNKNLSPGDIASPRWVNVKININDKWDYQYEPSIYFSPWSEWVLCNLENAQKVIPNEWLIDFLNGSTIKMYWNVTFQGEYLQFKISNDLLENLSVNSNIANISMLNKNAIDFGSNAYVDFLQHHINSYNNSLGWAENAQNFGMGTAYNSSPTTFKGFGGDALRSFWGWMGGWSNLFTGSATKEISALQSQMQDLKDIPGNLNPSSNIDFTKNLIWNDDMPKTPVNPDADKETFALSHLKFYNKRPSTEQQKTISFHYHLNGHPLNGNYFKVTDKQVQNRSIFNFWMLETLTDAFNIIKLPTWARVYFENIFREGVRIWKIKNGLTDQQIIDILAFVYDYQNWDESLLTDD